MKYVKTFEGFLDIFKPKRNETEQHLLSLYERLKKVQNLKENPYQVNKYYENHRYDGNTDITIDWIRPDYSGAREYYEVIFDDVTLLSLRKKYYHGIEGGTETFYETYIKETDSEQRNVEPISHISNSIKKKFWVILADIFDKQKQYKQSDRLGNMINPAADLL